MPEFVLNVNENDKRWSDLDYFTRGFVEAMFFTNCDTGDEDEYSCNELGFVALTDEALERIKDDCAKFQETYEELLDEAYANDDYDSERAGSDFWYTRQGHGVGFWCRKPLDRDKLGERLAEAAKRFPELYPSSHGGRIDF